MIEKKTTPQDAEPARIVNLTRPRKPHKMDLKRLDWVLCKAQDATTLTEWEDKFLNDFIERRERQGDAIKVSEKQEEILERIAEKD